MSSELMSSVKRPKNILLGIWCCVWSLLLGTFTSHQRLSIRCRFDSAFIWLSNRANRIKPYPLDWPVFESFLICTTSSSPNVSKYSRKLSSVVFHGSPSTIRSVVVRFRLSMRFVFGVEFSSLSSLLRLFSFGNTHMYTWLPQPESGENGCSLLSFSRTPRIALLSGLRYFSPQAPLSFAFSAATLLPPAGPLAGPGAPAVGFTFPVLLPLPVVDGVLGSSRGPGVAGATRGNGRGMTMGFGVDGGLPGLQTGSGASSSTSGSRSIESKSLIVYWRGSFGSNRAGAGRSSLLDRWFWKVCMRSVCFSSCSTVLKLLPSGCAGSGVLAVVGLCVSAVTSGCSEEVALSTLSRLRNASAVSTTCALCRNGESISLSAIVTLPSLLMFTLMKHCGCFGSGRGGGGGTGGRRTSLAPFRSPLALLLGTAGGTTAVGDAGGTTMWPYFRSRKRFSTTRSCAITSVRLTISVTKLTIIRMPPTVSVGTSTFSSTSGILLPDRPAGPLSIDPPSPGPSQNGGAKPGSQWQWPSLLHTPRPLQSAGHSSPMSCSSCSRLMATHC
uniref:Uncharacterized protein n=1 Tax=Anopheles coluzzii TaxID=1518534 RepID=A0A8W7PAL4_ANOCL